MANLDTITAKLNRNLLRAFAIGKLNLSKRALNLILILTKYVDYDSRIHIDKENLRKELFCDRRALNDALNELRSTTYNNKVLLTYGNGYYVSNFHVFSKGEYTYQKHLPVFTTEKVLNLTKNQTRLFFYITTQSVRNMGTKVAVENLYKNQLHDPNYGMNVYHHFQDFREDLFELIEQDLISVRIPGEKSDISLNKANPDYKEIFDKTCDFIDGKKLRTSKHNKKKHVIGLILNKSIFRKEAVPNQANEAEFRLLADRSHMFHEDFKQSTINFFISEKNYLFNTYGKAGLEIYRSSLEKYFKEKNTDILYYDITGDAKNHFTDFYLLEEVKKVILGALRSDFGKRGAISATGYSFTKVHIPNLVGYYIGKSGEEHKILIDQDIQLIKEAKELMSTPKEPWTSLQDSVELVYTFHTTKIKGIFRDECLKKGITPDYQKLEIVNMRELIVNLAKQKLLSKVEALEKQTEKVKQIVTFLSKKTLPKKFELKAKPETEEEYVRTVPFYNWLEN